MIYCLIEYFYIWIKYVLFNVIVQLEQFVEISEMLVVVKGINNGDCVIVFSKCGFICVVVVVMCCLKLLNVNGQQVEMVGILIYWGFEGVVCKGYIVNILMLNVGDVNL